MKALLLLVLSAMSLVGQVSWRQVTSKPTAMSPIEWIANSTIFRLKPCLNAGEAWRWDGAAWACRSTDPVSGGVGIVVSGGSVVGIDDLIVPNYASGSGAPSLSTAPAQTIYVDTDLHVPYIATNTDTFSRVALYSELGSGGSGSVTGLYSGAVDFSSIPDGGCVESTFTATGLSAGKTLAVSIPSTLESGLVVNAIASATDTLKLRACNFNGTAVDPASATFKVRDIETLGYVYGSATIDFGAIPDGGCNTDTITVTGAATGDNVAAGWPAALEGGLIGMMNVTSANTVTVRLCNWSGVSLDPTSATFKAAITK